MPPPTTTSHAPPMPTDQAVAMGFSADRRKRRRQHRLAARRLLASTGVFVPQQAPGTSFHAVAQWHLEQARWL